MTTIELKKISMLNFKGARKVTIDFERETDLMGRNKTGKTTVMDAFIWVLFGKDSTDSKSFSIKTFDENNVVIPKLEHKVTAVLDINGREITISRNYKEIWKTTRGESEKKFAGHETLYEWDGIACNEKEFQIKVNEIVKEDIFKLITNTGYFNSLNWKIRRNTLLGIAGKIEPTDVLDKVVTAKNVTEFATVINELNSRIGVDSNQVMEELKKKIANLKKPIRETLDSIGPRIEEATLNLPPFEIDYTEIENQIAERKKEIEDIDLLLTNKTEAKKKLLNLIAEKQQESFLLQQRCTGIRNEATNKVLDEKRQREKEIAILRHEVRTATDQLTRLRNDLNDLVITKDSLEDTLKKGRAEWDRINATKYTEPAPLVFNEDEFKCPTCQRPYETSDIEEKKLMMEKNYVDNADAARKKWTEEKTVKLLANTTIGKQTAAKLQELEKKVSDTRTAADSKADEITALQLKLRTAEDNDLRLTASGEQEVAKILAENAEFQQKTDKAQLLINEINDLAGPGNTSPNEELISQKRAANQALDTLKDQLSHKGDKEKVEARIKELENQQKTQAIELARLEGVEFSIEKFMMAKMDMLESRVNKMFKVVKFKMFKEQINGGFEETCEAIIGGVPYPDVNNGGKVNGDLDIINTLQDYYSVYAPIFVDNSESVNELIPVNSQLIRLVVTEDDTLKVVYPKK